ncbi:MAG: sulfopyruvate decarboxylase subunit alpha [Nitrospinota bacterium]
MAWSDKLYDELKASGVRLCTTVPDSWLAGLIARMGSDPEMIHVPVAREEEGVGVCCGAVAGGMRAAMVIQNVGAMNSGGAMATFPIAYGIPFLMIVSHRGRLGDKLFYDVEKGRSAERILEQVGVQCFPLPPDFSERGSVPDAYALAEAAQKPVALLITKETFGAGG